MEQNVKVMQEKAVLVGLNCDLFTQFTVSYPARADKPSAAKNVFFLSERKFW